MNIGTEPQNDEQIPHLAVGKDIAAVETCGPEQILRRFNNFNPDCPEFNYTPLKPDLHEVRLLRLHPTRDVASHLRCDIEIHGASNTPPFIAVKNARGYRGLKLAIEVKNQPLFISVALERFLRYLRTRIDQPTRIWVRYICLLEFDPQEQKTYWTREFSDNMYTRASYVFDMHVINNRLIENGYFERVYSSRYTRWKKEWYGKPKEVVLPQVCPVRLGTQTSHEAPTMQYRYVPLDVVADEIRIMCVMPAEDHTSPIVIHAAHCPMKCEVNYIALSYRWGTDSSPEQIVLTGQLKTIRQNLAEAIRCIRRPNMIVPIWIDAVSINQDDMAERSKEVRRMGDLYDIATAVYCWVGADSDDTAEAFDFMQELGKHPVIRVNGAGDFHFGEWGFIDSLPWYAENTISPDRLVTLCAALYKFLTRQYFRRAWILQEVACASSPTVIAGSLPYISFDTLDKAAYHLQDLLTRDLFLGGRMQAADSSVEVDVDMLAYPRKIFYFRHLLSNGGDDQFPFVRVKKTAPGFLEALVLTRDFECTDPRDHIFALWNIARDKTGLQYRPDYSKPYGDVYADFTRAWILQHGRLDILGAVELDPSNDSFYVDAPSWCPNWNTAATTSCLVRKDYIPTRLMSVLGDQEGSLYAADGNTDQSSFTEPMLSFQNDALHCRGLIIDEIAYLFDEPPSIPSFASAGLPHCNPDSNWQFNCFMRTVEQNHKTLNITAYDDPLRAAWAMFHGDSIAAWPPLAESGYTADPSDPKERYKCLPHLSRHVPKFANSYNRGEAWSAVKTVLRGRRPFISANGYMGLAPTYISQLESDKTVCQLAVVAGCSVPLLLRERPDGSFQLLGACFVQGWMEGEWAGAMMGAESPGEFWEAVGEGAGLVIT